jgi:hypothetical protein
MELKYKFNGYNPVNILSATIPQKTVGPTLKVKPRTEILTSARNTQHSSIRSVTRLSSSIREHTLLYPV